MKVGDYVRTEYGIDKIVRIEKSKDTIFCGDTIYCEHSTIPRWRNYKSSPNIIDLIEIGDYVNGECVSSITKNNYIETGYGEELVGLHNGDIKAVVTKEQFESIEYKVEE